MNKQDLIVAVAEETGFNRTDTKRTNETDAPKPKPEAKRAAKK